MANAVATSESIVHDVIDNGQVSGQQLLVIALCLFNGGVRAGSRSLAGCLFDVGKPVVVCSEHRLHLVERG